MLLLLSQMKKIRLTQGKQAIVDDSDFEWLNQWKWHYSNGGYAERNLRLGVNKRKTLQLHRLLLERQEGFNIDHINRNKLDNRRDNLRVVTPSQNSANSSIKRSSKIGCKGVSYHVWGRSKKNWVARIHVDGKRKWLGRFKTKEEAARNYNQASIKYHKEFSYLNAM